ncbi:MAG: nitroreductase family protein [Spirochaetia bacterium]|nr:nitroreductase family protein [Spirochaetia bacterium]
MKNNLLFDSLKTIAHKRKSIRHFKTEKIPREDVEKIMEIAKTSPYAGGRKDWEIILVDDLNTINILKDIIKKKIELVYTGAKNEFRQMLDDYAKYFYSFETAPLLMIPVYKPRGGLVHAFESDPYGAIKLDEEGIIKSIACVAMMTILAAESLGYNTCFVHGACIASDEIVSHLNIKKNKKIGAIIPVGYAQEAL